MLSRLLGEYLLEERLVTPEQFRRVLDRAASAKVKIGTLAINAGYMAAAQVEEIHELQKTRDLRFGDLAVEKGYLTDAQLQELLRTQPKEDLLLGQSLVEEGLFSWGRFETILRDYREKNAIDEKQFEAIRRGDVEALVWILFRGRNVLKQQFFVKYISLFLRNVIRFLDAGASLVPETADTYGDFPHVTIQLFKGKVSFFSAVAAKEDVLLSLASRFAGEKLERFDEFAQASIAEFFNLVNGLFAVNCSHEGVEMDLLPPLIERNVGFGGDLEVVRVPVGTNAGVFTLFVAPETPRSLLRKLEGGH
jgi:hypothetical protein